MLFQTACKSRLFFVDNDRNMSPKENFIPKFSFCKQILAIISFFACENLPVAALDDLVSFFFHF